MAEVNKGPLSTILIYNDSTVRARDRGGGEKTTVAGSYAGLILSRSNRTNGSSSSARRL